MTQGAMKINHISGL